MSVEDQDTCLTRGLETLRSELRIFWNDFLNRRMVIIKVIYFLQSAAAVSLYPFLTLHMKAAGFSTKEVAIINFITPVADVVMPTVVGFVADKIGNFRIFASSVALLDGCASLLLLTIQQEVQEVTSDLCCYKSEQEDYLKCFWENSPSISEMEKDLNCSSPNDNQVYKAFLTNPKPNQCSTYHCSWLSNTGNLGVGVASNIFWIYFLIRIIIDVSKSSEINIVDTANLTVILDEKADIGYQKMYGQLAAIIFGPLAGRLIDWQQSSSPAGDLLAPYTSVILLFFGIRLISTLLLLTLKLDFKPKGEQIFKEVFKFFTNLEAISIFLVYLICGMLWGFLDNFFFWLMQDLGATKFLMGMTHSVSTLFGIFLSMCSGCLIRTFGHEVVLITALLCYATRLSSYTVVSCPELFLFLEILKPFCTTLLIIAISDFVGKFTPRTSNATTLAISRTCHFGIGRGLGCLIGGLAMKDFGSVTTFRMFAILASVSAFVYELSIFANTRIIQRKYWM